MLTSPTPQIFIQQTLPLEPSENPWLTAASLDLQSAKEMSGQIVEGATKGSITALRVATDIISQGVRISQKAIGQKTGFAILREHENPDTEMKNMCDLSKKLLMRLGTDTLVGRAATLSEAFLLAVSKVTGISGGFKESYHGIRIYAPGTVFQISNTRFISCVHIICPDETHTEFLLELTEENATLKQDDSARTFFGTVFDPNGMKLHGVSDRAFTVTAQKGMGT